MKPQIDPLVADAMKELSPWVRHIRYEVKPDWDGTPALFFRVLLSDMASAAFKSWHSIRTTDAAQDFLLQLFLPKLR